MTVADRIENWRNSGRGEEEEDFVSLLCDAMDELRAKDKRIEELETAARNATAIEPRRAPVRQSRMRNKPNGTITWDEHVEAWRDYEQRYRGPHSAERVSSEGGFDYAELVCFLGHQPKTWRPA